MVRFRGNASLTGLAVHLASKHRDSACKSLPRKGSKLPLAHCGRARSNPRTDDLRSAGSGTAHAKPTLKQRSCSDADRILSLLTRQATEKQHPRDFVARELFRFRPKVVTNAQPTLLDHVDSVAWPGNRLCLRNERACWHAPFCAPKCKDLSTLDHPTARGALGASATGSRTAENCGGRTGCAVDIDAVSVGCRGGPSSTEASLKPFPSTQDS